MHMHATHAYMAKFGHMIFLAHAAKVPLIQLSEHIATSSVVEKYARALANKSSK